MLGTLTEKFQNVFSSLASNKKLTEDNISDAVRQVRLALLDADVNYSVASKFIKKVKEKVLGTEIIKSVSAADQFVKIIHDELVSIMGGESQILDLKSKPTIIMLCGLQGAGKTTQAAKLAAFLKQKEFSRTPLLIACDLQRPAAIEQLKTLGSQINVPVFSHDTKDPLKVAKLGLREAEKIGADTIIVDTAGRLHIDDTLMGELESLKKYLNPSEILFVSSASAGQDAVNTAKTFNEKVEITGSILTMLDGSSRAGVAISIAQITNKPLKFEGIGEKIEDLQPFNPKSMADRILGMGDVINLVRKAKLHIDDEAEDDLEHKLKTASFTYEDYLKQMGMIKKMGSMKSLMKMMPGMNQMSELEMSDKEFSKLEAMILSMTLKERRGLHELEPSRRRRIASGSGAKIDDVNRMIKGFKRLKQFCKNMPSFKKKLQKNKSLMPSKLFDGFFS